MQLSRLSAFSGQLSAFGSQLSVFSLPEHRKLVVLHPSSFILQPAPCSAIPIAALRRRSAAIEGETLILAVTKSPIKQAPNASGSLARRFQLQR
jgi:hypothetical protein